MNSRLIRADALLTLTALIWGAAFVAQRVGMDHVGPYTYNAIRFALGSLALVPLILRLKAQRKRKWSESGALENGAEMKKLALGGFLAGLALFAGSSFQQVGIVYTTAGKAGFITGLYVVFVPILGLFFGQKTGLGTWAGALLAAVGMYLLSVTGEMTIGHGDMLVLISALFWAGHVLLIGKLSPGMDATDAVRLSSFQFAVCSVLSMSWALISEEITLEGILGGTWPILYGGLMSVGVAYTLQVVAQHDAKPAHAAIILSLEAVFAAIAGWFILGEVLGLRALVGCGLMLAGMLLSQLRP